MIIDNQEQVTEAVLKAMSSTRDPRLREVMSALVTHLHQFARQVRLTESEFELAIEFLNRIGRATNDQHNEGVLFSDILGLSTLVCLLNNGNSGATETASALLGPFWRMHSPLTKNDGSILRSETSGPTLEATCWVRDVRGEPIAGVEIDVWQASPVGLYENQDPDQADMNLRGKFRTDSDGYFGFTSVKPAGYPVPTHGPAGDLLRAQQRHPYRPAHLHFLAFKPGFKTLITQVFVDGDDHLDTDVVFGVTRSLIGGFRRIDDGVDAAGERYRFEHTFVMEPGEALLPNPPIK
jgi:catechol 1,2-dioxygenase